MIEIVVVGAHLSGLPLNHELVTEGGVLRRAVVDALGPLGAAHLQLGRFYPWLERRDPAFRGTVEALKRVAG